MLTHYICQVLLNMIFQPVVIGERVLEIMTQNMFSKLSYFFNKYVRSMGFIRKSASCRNPTLSGGGGGGCGKRRKGPGFRNSEK